MNPPPRSGVAPGGARWLEGGGDMGERIRRLDWSRTPLGLPDTWPASLRTAVRIMLTSRQPIWIGWGPELTYLYNDPYKSIIGGKHPDALGKPFAEVWREIYDVVGPMARHVMSSNEGTYVEAQLLVMERHGYQEETYYTFSYSPIPGDDGEPGGLICANTDDTRRVIGERQIALLRELAFRTVNTRSWEDACASGAQAFETNTRDLAGTWIYTRDTQAQSVSLVATSGLATGRSQPPADGTTLCQPTMQLVDLAPAEGAAPRDPATATPRRAAVLPIDPSGKGSRAFCLVVALNPLRQFDENYRGFLELVAGQLAAGIANAQAYEEESRRAQALAELDRAKTIFFSNVSHEFRTPLTLMLGPVEDSLNDTRHMLDPVQRERLELVRRGGLRLHKLVNSLLEFSRLEAGRIRATFAPVDLAALTTDLAGSFRSTIEKAGLRLTVDCAHLGELAYVDADMWEKMVLNLLSNAFKFTFDGEIAVRLDLSEQYFELTVQDSGIGIDPAELPTIFDRFRRVEGARSRSHEGSGIGLALVQELAQLHGGDVQVHSAPDAGSRFTVRVRRGTGHLAPEHLASGPAQVHVARHAESFVVEAQRWLPAAPLAAASAAPAVVDRPGHTEARRERIVWADDNADLRNYVARLLDARYTVEAVEDGEAALAAVRRSRPALVLCDVMMPRMDGVALLRMLRADPTTQDIPVILLSARAGEEASIEGLDAGADDYLVKPFSAGELLARVGARVELSRMRARVEQEQRALARVFEQTPVATAVMLGPDFVFQRINSAYQRIFESRELLGKPLLEALPELADQGIVQLMETVVQTGEPFVGREFPAQLMRDGNIEDGFFDFIFAPMRNGDGVAEGIVAIGIEVTEQVVARRKIEGLMDELNGELAERKRAQDALSRSEDRLSRALEAGELGAWELDVVDGTAWRSPMHDRIFGYPGLLPSWSYEDFMAHVLPEDRAQVQQRFDHALASASDWDFECRIRRADGEHRWIAVQGRLDVGGDMQLTRMKGLVRDITNRRLAQDTLREADRRKDEFIATLSHELRNPLAPLRNALHLLRLRGGDEQQQRVFDMMERQVNHLVRLVDDLLELSRISRGTFELRRQHTTIDHIVRHAVDTASPLIDAEGHTLQVTLPEASVWLEGDAVRIAQILANLLNNAARYTDPGGQIFVEAQVEGNEVQVRVRDTGHGIAPEALSGLFQMFNRGEQSTRRHQGGLGIGLSLARRLAEMHGGSLDAYSQGLGRGSTFTLRLPLSDAPTPTTQDHHRPVPDSAALQVLVVDDNRDAAHSLADVLSALGAEVQLAYDGGGALQVLRKFDPTMILLDIGMPGMDGYEVARRIRTEFAGRRAMLIALTGWGQENDRVRTRDAGFDHHLVKPADIDDLQRLLAVAAAS